MNGARDEVLQRVRRAVSGAGSERELEYAAIPREYRERGTLDAGERVILLAERLRDYEAGVYRCPEAQIAATVREVMRARSKTELLIAPDVSSTWLPDDFSFRADAGFSYAELDRSQGVLTGCALAIAVTGTIVLRHDVAEGRRALTLIPDYHLCVVFANQAVETVSEGIREMAKFGSAPITTISGPSATADIEMTRVKGVHGPRVLDVILVDR